MALAMSMYIVKEQIVKEQCVKEQSVKLPTTGSLYLKMGLLAITLASFLTTAMPVSAKATCSAQGVPPAGVSAYVCLDADSVASLYQKPRSYRIMRKGKRIGKHTLRITHQQSANANQVDVAVKSRIRVKVLKVPVFSFDYQSSELWLNGQLQQVEAETTENSKTTVVSAKREGQAFKLKGTNGGTSSAENGLSHTSNHWNPGVLSSGVLFNTLTGKPNQVSVESLGSTALELPVGTVQATHFRYSGNLQADVWYDSDGRWVQLAFKGGDGSNILYQFEGELD